jgi:transketolase
MNEIVSQRDAFWGEICRQARADRDIVVVSADFGAPALDAFRRDFPDRFVNVGIAEQNAVVVAAGLAMSGKKVFVYAIAPFVTLRCLEQVRVEGGMMNIPLTLVGVGAGFGYEDSGPTHHMVEDLSIMRALPNMTVHSVSDSRMAEALARLCCEGPPALRYARLDRTPFPDIHGPASDFRAGFTVLGKGKDGWLVGTGAMTHAALDLAGALAARGIRAGVIDVHAFPFDESRFARTIKGARRIVSIEEHFLPGGLGSALAELLADRGLPVALKRLGMRRERGYCYEYGGREAIRRHYGLDARALERAAAAFLSGGER